MIPEQNEPSHRTPDKVLESLRHGWILAVVALALPLLVALFVPRMWIPFTALAEAFGLSLLLNRRNADANPFRSLLLRVTQYSLLFTGIIMLVIVILCTDRIIPTVIYLRIYNPELPFITCLVEFPVLIILTSVFLYMGFAEHHSRRNLGRYHYYAGDSILATFYFREARYQLSAMLVISILLGACEYWYYFVRYINSDINTPDRFFFNYMPLIIYAFSALLMRWRYANIRMLFAAVDEASPGRANTTSVRYLIFCDDDLLLRACSDDRWDTPAEVVLPRCRAIGDDDARRRFENLTGVTDAHMRYCFTNEGFAAGSNIIHYAVFVSPDDRTKFGADDMWFNAYMLDRSLAANTLAPVLANELYRIHTITMAWKTYDRQGRKLYPIKHYRPTFRLRDLRTWDVDYDDDSWFDVAHNNEDRNFYRLRALWQRIVRGTGRQTS